MNIASGALLIVVSATSMCKVDNLDSSKIEVLEFTDMEKCEVFNKSLDSKRGVRSTCVEGTSSDI